MDEFLEWDGEYLCSYRVVVRNIFFFKIFLVIEIVYVCVKKYVEDIFSID